MASIKKNANGTYSAVVYVGRDSNNKMLREYVTRDGLKECKNAVRDLEEEIANRSLNNLSRMKMCDYMDKWFEINKPFLANTTIKAYKTYIDLHFTPAFGNLRVNQITDMQIKKYLSDKLKCLSSTTVRKHYFTLAKMFYDTLKTKSPCLGIKAPQNSEFTPTIPTEVEFERIHQVFKSIGLQDEVIILLAGWCGLRRGEIFALKWDDINEKDCMIRVDEAVALEEEGYQFELKSPKSANGIRTIIAPDYVMSLLKDMRQLKPKKKSKKDEIKNNNKAEIKPEIFSYNPDSFSKKYRKIINLKSNNLPKIRFHDLRHYHASLLYKNNVPDQYAAGRLGHDIWVLKKIYQHLGLEETKELDQQVKNIFK